MNEGYRLVFTQGAEGMRRVIGGSVELLAEYDLMLVRDNIGDELLKTELLLDRANMVSINFSKKLFEGFSENLSFMPVHRMLLDCSFGISFSLSAIMRVYAQMKRFLGTEDELLRTLKLARILYELGRFPEEYRAFTEPSFPGGRRNAESKRILKLKKYIANNFNKGLSLHELSDIAGLSPSSLSRFFKQQCGMSLMDYIIEVRLGNAARMLIETAESVSEIAYTCGFQNISNFNRLFKRNRGCTPTCFRKEFQCASSQLSATPHEAVRVTRPR